MNDDIQPREPGDLLSSSEPQAPAGFTKKERRELRRQEKIEAATDTNRRRRMRSVGIWLAVAVVVGGSVWAFTKFGGAGSAGQTASLLEAVSADDWVRGRLEAGVVLVEYGDYQCPACAAYHPVVERLVGEFGDRIAFAYRHFPLRSIHRHADLAAQAAEAAGKQGKFWEMHAKLYENQRDWANTAGAREIFIGYAESLELNRDEFLRDLDSRETKDRVEQDLASAQRLGLSGTPSFFLNGKRIDNPRTYDDFRTLINRSLTP